MRYWNWLVSAAALGVFGIASVLASSIPEGALESSVKVQLTKRGQNYFYQNLEDVLFLNGVSVRKINLPEWRFEAREAIDLDHLPPELGRYQESIIKLRDTLRKWLTGFELKDPRFAAMVKDFRYAAQFSRMGVRIDNDETERLGIRDGAVFVVDIEMPQMQVSAVSLRGTDLGNSEFGEIGLNNFRFGLAKDSKPFKISVPFLMQANEREGTRVHGLEIQTNLQSLKLDFDYASPLVIPEMGVILNGKRYMVDPAGLERDLRAQQPKLLKDLQTYLKEAAVKQLPEMITKIGQQRADTYREMRILNPPGLKNPRPLDMFRYFIAPQAMTNERDYLEMKLYSVVEDPQNPGSPGLLRSSISGVDPKIPARDRSTYDAAVAVNEGMFNRSIQLSHQRGYFKKVITRRGKEIRLGEPPVFKFGEGGGPNNLKLKLVVEMDSHGWDKIAISGGFVRIFVDANVRIKKSSRGSFMLEVISLDHDSIEVDPDCIRFGILKPLVYKKVYEEMDFASQDYGRLPEVVLDEFPMPAFFGVPTKLVGWEALPSGFLAVYVQMGS